VYYGCEKKSLVSAGFHFVPFLFLFGPGGNMKNACRKRCRSIIFCLIEDGLGKKFRSLTGMSLNQGFSP
jgi:hypothetical protein